MTKHIAVVSGKGGSNKSTLCKCFHKTLRQHDVNAWGDDNDPQQHFMNYLNKNAIEPNQKDVMIYDTLGAWTSVNRDFIKTLQEHDHVIVIPVGESNADCDDEHLEAMKMLTRIKELGGEFNVYILYSSLHHAAKRPINNDESFVGLGAKVINTFIPRLNKYKYQNISKDKKITDVLKEIGAL